MKKIAIITARSGSKGLPNKNILLLGNKPLIAYSIEAALKSRAFERVIVSTDSLEYKYISELYGAEVFIRRPEISGDNASSFVVIEDVLKRLKEEYDYFVLLQPTSPFRTEDHINESIELFEKNFENFDFLVSMMKSDKSSNLIVNIDEDNSLKNFKLDFSSYARQKYNEYTPNGAIFAGKIDKYLEKKHFYGEKSLAYYMNKEDSVDIDDKLDFEVAISILMRKNKDAILEKNIKEQIEKKENDFNNPCDVALIGHSILANWNIENLGEYKLNNLAIAGISTKQYQKWILNERKINNLPKNIILMLGTNDIVDEDLTDDDIVNQINKLIENLYKINSETKIYFLEISSVAFRMDRKKERIYGLNLLLKKRLNKNVKYVEINKYLTDDFGNLKLIYTDDGLHFNKNSYEVLKEIVKKELKI